ncbi:hypothetical protein BLNAU_15283 [Blattamonas nauphoetae]|uniref:Right handed beta helix domain-containing protein n=1 Tax=Blattamonas nauphoetae TaxID=2049346 RepID=A0ABQ9XCY3_9EUKA|nr:hypothetical protein BLNAU_15283 [Blattamonas nauphoetae]
MFLSLFVVFASIHPDSIDLLDVMKEYADDTTEITLEAGVYFARNLQLKDRNLTFIGNVNTVTLDLQDFEDIAFDLETSSLSLVSILIKPSQKAVFAKGHDDSTLNVTACEYDVEDVVYPILQGSKTQLLVQNMTFSAMNFTSSLVQGVPGDNKAALSLIVQHSSFTGLTILSQNPVLAGADVQNVSVYNTSFSQITCQNEDPLPEEPVEGTPNRGVSMKKVKISHVDGALSGALVFAMQASKMYLTNVRIEDSANAVRYSNNVAFAPKSEVVVRMTVTKFTTTTEIWPNGGFLFLPHSQSTLTIHHTEAQHSSAPNGNGGWVYVAGHTTLDFQLVDSSKTSAGKCGGFVFAGGVVERLFFAQVVVNDSKAEEDGGGLFVSHADVMEINYGEFTRCDALQNGGAVFVDVADDTRMTFSEDTFTENEAIKGYGHDVLVSYHNTTTYRVQKSDFKKCTSTRLSNGVWILPFNVGEDWTNSNDALFRKILIFSIVGGSVFLALCIVIPCICCCCCGCCCCACCRTRKPAEYQNIEAQQHTYVYPPPTYSPKQQQPEAYQPLLQGQNAPQSQINYQPLPQQYVYTPPVDQPAQMEQYPAMPNSQVGVDQTVNKE